MLKLIQYFTDCARLAPLLEQVRDVTPQGAEESDLVFLLRVFRELGYLARHEKKDRTVIENAPVVLCSIDAEGTIMAVNPGSSRLFGHEPQELIGRHYSLLFAERHQERVISALSRRISERSSSPFTALVARKDGQELITLWYIFWSNEENALFCTVVERKDDMENLTPQS